MAYPINEQVFIELWIKNLDSPDDADREFAGAVATALNGAYRAGVEDGRKKDE